MLQSKRPLLIFLHVQKCGGTTFRDIIEDNYNSVLHLNEWKHRAGWKVLSDFAAMTEKEQKKRTSLMEQYDAIVGHYPYGVHAMLDRPSEYITMLREPTDRLRSLFEYWLHSHVGEKVGANLGEFLIGNRYGWALKDNHMVRVFLGSDGFTVPYGKLTERHTQIAMENLNKCHYVGLVEDYDASLAYFARELAWRNVAYVPKNITKHRSESPERLLVDERTRMAVEEHTKWDRVLYACAKQRLSAELQHMHAV